MAQELIINPPTVNNGIFKRYDRRFASADYLPSEGVFCGYSVIYKPIPYVRIYSTNGGSIVLNNLLISIQCGDITNIEIIKITNESSKNLGKFLLKRESFFLNNIRNGASNDMRHMGYINGLLNHILKKKFTAKPLEVYIDIKACDTKKEVKETIIKQRYYIVELKQESYITPQNFRRPDLPHFDLEPTFKLV